MINNTTVTTSATEVLEAPTKPFSFVAISNNGSATAYLKVVAGGDAVTTSNGIPLAAGAAFVVDQDQQARYRLRRRWQDLSPREPLYILASRRAYMSAQAESCRRWG